MLLRNGVASCILKGVPKLLQNLIFFERSSAPGPCAKRSPCVLLLLRTARGELGCYYLPSINRSMENRSKRGSVALPILYNRLVLSRTCKPHPGLRSWGGVPEWVKFPPESSGLGFRGAEFEPKLYHLPTCALGQNHPTCLNFRLSACKIRIIMLPLQEC